MDLEHEEFESGEHSKLNYNAQNMLRGRDREFFGKFFGNAKIIICELI